MRLCSDLTRATCASLPLLVTACAGQSVAPAAASHSTSHLTVVAPDRTADPGSGGLPGHAAPAGAGVVSDVARSERARSVQPETLKLADLPLVKWPKPLSDPDAAAKASLPPAPEVVIDMMGRELKPDESTLVRVTLQGQKLAWIRVGRNEGAVTDSRQGGVTVMCGAKASGDAFLAARWETLAAAPGAGLVYTVVDGWLDVRSCKVGAVARTSVTALPILGGVFFAFREACTDCAHEVSVTVLGPRLGRVAASGMGGEATIAQGAWSRVTLPVRRGGVGSLLARTSSFDLQSWASACGIPTVSGVPSGELLVGVEISQAVNDTYPTAVAFVSAHRFSGQL